MRSDLQVISFLCAALLAILLLLPRIRGNVANLAIVIWLLTCNLIHGINAVIWADNIDLHVPAWCDIGTRVLLGAIVALPGACVCLSGRMELLSSKRRIPDDPKAQRTRLIIEFIFCYIIPILYILLHLIAQDHRFGLVKDYGCSVSIFPAGPTLAIMFIPPLLLCILSFALAGRAIHNSCLQSTSEFAVYIETRAPVTSSTFVRRICLTLFLTAILFIMGLFNVFATNGIVSYPNFGEAHKDMWTIKILFNEDDAASIRAAWYAIPVVSIAYLLFMFALGEEVREGVKWLVGKVKKMKKPEMPRFDRNVLPLHFIKGQDNGKTQRRARPKQDTAPRPLTLVLRSGWDDMLDEPKRQSPSPWSMSGRKTPSIGRPSTPLTPTLGNRTPSPLPRIDTSVTATDDAFIASTMDYVTSPTARTLGIGASSSALSPPPVYLTPLQTRLDTDPFRCPSPPTYASPSRSRADPNANPFQPEKSRASPTSPNTPSSLSPPLAPFARRPEDMPPTPQSVPKDIDADSIMSAVLDDYWPQPPVTPTTPSLRTAQLPLPTVSPNRRRPVSPASTVDTSVSTLWSVQEESHARESFKPFQGPGISAPLTIPPRTASPQHKKQRSLRRMLSAESKYSTVSYDGVYMTVVKETTVESSR